MSHAAEEFDAIVIGGGPGGATAALVLARAGRRVAVLEKASFPRFHIGESFLPKAFELLRDLGLEPHVRGIPHVPKYGAEFVMGDDERAVLFDFDPGRETINVERSLFDAMLLQEAQNAGAALRQPTTVSRIETLRDGEVVVATDGGEKLRGKFLIDASGQAAVVARHLGTRRKLEGAHLQNVAYFQHFHDVRRNAGREGGHPLIIMAEEGWFWMIPLDERRTSVGLVLNPALARRLREEENIPANRVLDWGIARCPAARNRMMEASGPDTNLVGADFSYRCRPYAGEGYFLVGDAASFQDPIFSTGVCLAMIGGQSAGLRVDDLLAGRTSASRARRRHIRLIEGGTRPLFHVIRQYYDQAFRELFLQGCGPLQVHRAVIGILAGNVFPRPPFRLWWRLRLFDLFFLMQHYFPMVPRRERFSLLACEPAPWGAPQSKAGGEKVKEIDLELCEG